MVRDGAASQLTERNHIHLASSGHPVGEQGRIFLRFGVRRNYWMDLRVMLTGL